MVSPRWFRGQYGWHDLIDKRQKRPHLLFMAQITPGQLADEVIVVDFGDLRDDFALGHPGDCDQQVFRLGAIPAM